MALLQREYPDLVPMYDQLYASRYTDEEIAIWAERVRRLAAKLAEISPGVQRGTREGTWIGAGQRDIQNSLTLDGINSAANLMPSTSMQPIADAVEEVVVQTGSTSAEFGSYLGVHVNVVTKSGTNTPHGSLSYFFQGDELDARGFFEDRTAPANPRSYNQFAVQADR